MSPNWWCYGEPQKGQLVRTGAEKTILQRIRPSTISPFRPCVVSSYQDGLFKANPALPEERAPAYALCSLRKTS